MDIKQILAKITSLPDCTVFPPIGSPKVESNRKLPDELIEFYQLCGGVELYRSRGYAIKIVSPDELVRANPVIIGDIPGIPNSGIPEGDISDDWYIIADDFNGDYLTIDLSIQRNGRCYDSFHELHPGNSQIIAWSFSELLERLVKNEGNRWYWLEKAFVSLGLVYDHI